MKEIARGSQKAFAELFERHSKKVLGYAKRLLGGDMELAEDISQSVWMKVVAAAPEYQGRGEFIAWLYTIIRNTALSEIRDRSRWDVEEEIGEERSEDAG